MIDFARVCDAIAATPDKTQKIQRLAAYLSSLSEADLRAAVRFVAGDPLPAGDDRRLAIGGRTLIAAARAVWSPAEAALGEAYRATGDLGDALARIVRPPTDLGLFRETLAPAGFAVLLEELASAPAGKASGRRRAATCERAFRACEDPREAAYVAKILLGDLRIGLREGLVLDAIAAAFDRDPAVVRRAAMAAGDLGVVAAAARADALDRIAIRYGSAIGPMLASPIAFGSSYKELASATWLVEDKYDGIRAQAHVDGEVVRLFTRTGGECSRAFPEIVTALRGGARAILDGEIVASRDGAVLPFRYLQHRLGRVDPSAEVLRDVPAAFIAFDALALGERFLLDEPLAERRAALAENGFAGAHASIAPWQTLETGATGDAIAELFEAARARGHEGLVFKRTDAPYVPGRRGKWWYKLKRELSTLDVVVVAVEWGHGKRKAVLSDYTFAVRRSATDPRLATIGKAYTGLTDAELDEMTRHFLTIASPANGRRARSVEPMVVIEIAFDVVAESALHDGGFALRFPRIVRLRPDKPVAEIDTLEDVEAIYRAMLERENVMP